tara:strand:+ start:1415 stop:1624 length:210 start_codon:yes stop_codon:yes gene_type:complete
MKVGDLVYWNCTTRTERPELGIIIDEDAGQIRVVDLGGDRHGDTDWWDIEVWSLFAGKTLQRDLRCTTL